MPYIKKPTVVSWRDKNGKRVPPGTKGAKKHKSKARKWYGYGIPGKTAGKGVPLSSDKTAAQTMLADLVRHGERRAAGMSVGDHSGRKLSDHVADWEAAMLAEGTSKKHAGMQAARVRRLIAGCGFETTVDLVGSKIQLWLAELRTAPKLPAIDPRKQDFTKAEAAGAAGTSPPSFAAVVRRLGLGGEGNGKARRFSRAVVEAVRSRLAEAPGQQTSNHYLAGVKAFVAWLKEDGRISENPIAHLRAGNADLDRRHARRDLDVPDLLRLFERLKDSARVFRGLNAADRLSLYLTAAGTGFRASELAALTPEWFQLEELPPRVLLPKRLSKNRKGATQPLPGALAEILRERLTNVKAGDPLWPGGWVGDAAEMLQMDLEDAGIPYVVASPDGPLHADFHSLRHTFISLLVVAGATVKEAQVLARHSDPKLTIGLYSHAQLGALGETVGRLPSLSGPAPVASLLDDAPRPLLKSLAAVGLAMLALHGFAFDEP